MRAFFHLKVDGKIRKQGQIKRILENKIAEVVWFSWVDGCENGKGIINIDDPNVFLYANDKEMRIAYDKEPKERL